MRITSLPVWFTVLCLTAACDTARETSVYPPGDSAGVAIFTLHGEARARLADLSASAAIPLLSKDSTVFLQGVVGGLRLPDLYAVGSRYTSQVVFYDDRGRGSAALGREGTGPGEFSRLVGLVQVGGDTLAALDAQSRRISLLTSHGFIRDYALRPPHQAAPAGQAGVVGHLGEGRLLMWLQTMPGAQELARLNRANTTGQIPVVLFSVDSAGAAAEPIGVFPGEEQYMGTLPGRQELANYGPAPFGRWTRFGVHNQRVYVMNNATGRVAVYSADGKLRTLYRTDWKTRDVSAADRTRMIEEWVRRSPRQEEWNNRRARFEQMVYPTTMPSFRDALVGTDGVLWLEPYTSWNGQRRHFIGYDSTGAAVGRLQLGYREQILQIGGKRALILRYREDDTEEVRSVQWR